MSTLSRKNKPNAPLLVGLTGGIGSGKSTVAKIFKAKGVKVFNSDVIAKEILNNNYDLKQEIIRLFGDVYNENGVANTKEIASKVFSTPELLEELNQIIHPKVNASFNEWISENSNEHILIKEAAILIETEAYKSLDVIVLVVAPEELRVKRVLNRDNTNLDAVKKRIKAQMSDEEKLKHSNYIITNDESGLLIPQVENILKEIQL